MLLCICKLLSHNSSEHWQGSEAPMRALKNVRTNDSNSRNMQAPAKVANRRLSRNCANTCPSVLRSIAAPCFSSLPVKPLVHSHSPLPQCTNPGTEGPPTAQPAVHRFAANFEHCGTLRPAEPLATCSVSGFVYHLLGEHSGTSHEVQVPRPRPGDPRWTT
jgi:hypothetical protein